MATRELTARRVRTETITELRIYRPAIRNGIRGLAGFRTGIYSIQFLGRTSPKLHVATRTGETHWFGSLT